MLGETQEPILPHPRSAEHMRERKKQVPVIYCLRVKRRDVDSDKPT